MKRKVMLVDDELDMLSIMKMNLESTGNYEVLTLSTAKDIITHLNAFRPDIVLLDLLMPEIGGLDACKMLNEDPLGRRTPVIILSALDKDVDKVQAYKLGVVDYLEKPIERDILVAKIERALSLKNG